MILKCFCNKMRSVENHDGDNRRQGCRRPNLPSAAPPLVPCQGFERRRVEPYAVACRRGARGCATLAAGPDRASCASSPRIGGGGYSQLIPDWGDAPPCYHWSWE